MILTYAEQSLLQLDNKGQLQDFLSRYAAMEWARPRPRITDGDNPQNSRSLYWNDKPLPTVNYPPLPNLPFNQLYMPSGATRWTFGHFLVDEDTLLTIEEKTSNYEDSATFDLDDEVGNRITLDMWGIKPVRLQSADWFGGDRGIHAITLVDYRYWWQFKYHEGIVWSANPTWEDFIAQLATDLDKEIVRDLTCATDRYGYPNHTQFFRMGENAATILDVVAYSLGRKIISRKKLDTPGATEYVPHLVSHTWAESLLEDEQAEEHEFPVTTGDKIQVLPRRVRFFFPTLIDADINCGENNYSLFYDGYVRYPGGLDDEYPLAVFSYLPDTDLAVHSSAYAVFGFGTAGTNADNHDFLQCLVDAWGESYYRWQRMGSGSRAVQGLAPEKWINGYEDYRLLDLGSNDAFTTRIAYQQHDQWLNDQWSQENELPVGECQFPPSVISDQTTTTPNPAVDIPTNPCLGECWFDWDEDLWDWVVRPGDTCADQTTTTSGPTTSTTPDPGATTPCPCADRPTLSGETSTTADPGTTQAPCSCLKPDFCGYYGSCTRTFCAPGGDEHPSPCSTTTCDCNTTTTAGPTTTQNPNDCNLGCDWVGSPSQGGCDPEDWIWIKTRDDCASFCLCGVPTADPYCNTALTACVQVPDPPDPPDPPCTDSCDWWWVPGFDSWVLCSYGCPLILTGPLGFERTAACTCDRPSLPGDECKSISTPCYDHRDPGTSTTPDPNDPPNDCWYTCNTTTPVPDPCDSHCWWKWSTVQSRWVQFLNPCPGTCPCSRPAIDGTEDCQIERTRCGTKLPDPTTTPDPATSTTPAPTTTTPDPCVKPCAFQCVGGRWRPVPDLCGFLVNCECDDSVLPGGGSGPNLCFGEEGDTINSMCAWGGVGPGDPITFEPLVTLTSMAVPPVIKVGTNLGIVVPVATGSAVAVEPDNEDLGVSIVVPVASSAVVSSAPGNIDDTTRTVPAATASATAGVIAPGIDAAPAG